MLDLLRCVSMLFSQMFGKLVSEFKHGSIFTQVTMVINLFEMLLFVVVQLVQVLELHRTVLTFKQSHCNSSEVLDMAGQLVHAQTIG